MFKFAHAFFLSALLVSTLNAADNDSLAESDVNSDVEAFKEDLVEDGDESIGEDRIEDDDESIGEQLKRSSVLNGRCPIGFKYLDLAQSCYQVLYESHDWYSASTRCQQLYPGAHLIAINSHAENNAVTTFLSYSMPNHHSCIPREYDHVGGFFWTAGQRENPGNCRRRNPWVWKLTSSRRQPFSFTWWLPKEPNCARRREHCMTIWPMKGFGWNDEPCHVKVCPVCEYTP